MQIMFAMGFEECLSVLPCLKSRVGNGQAARLAYQDDAYLFGKASGLARSWPALEAALASRGHRLRTTKSQAWSPLCDRLDGNELPAGVAHFCSLVPRARGGLVLLGGAALGELAVCTPWQ